MGYGSTWPWHLSLPVEGAVEKDCVVLIELKKIIAVKPWRPAKGWPAGAHPQLTAETCWGSHLVPATGCGRGKSGKQEQLSIVSYWWKSTTQPNISYLGLHTASCDELGLSTGSSCGKKQERKEAEEGKPFQIRESVAKRQLVSSEKVILRDRDGVCAHVCVCARVRVVRVHRRQQQQSLIYCDKMNSPQDAHPAANSSSYLLCEWDGKTVSCFPQIPLTWKIQNEFPWKPCSQIQS